MKRYRLNLSNHLKGVAQAAREMLLRGDWVTTTLAGEPWYDKPILYYWTALVGYHVLGDRAVLVAAVTEWIGRPSVLATNAA